jgi:hypothetical protein
VEQYSNTAVPLGGWHFLSTAIFFVPLQEMQATVYVIPVGTVQMEMLEDTQMLFPELIYFVPLHTFSRFFLCVEGVEVIGQQTFFHNRFDLHQQLLTINPKLSIISLRVTFEPRWNAQVWIM